MMEMKSALVKTEIISAPLSLSRTIARENWPTKINKLEKIEETIIRNNKLYADRWKNSKRRNFI